MKRIAVFAHFDEKNRISPAVVYYLEQLKEICDEIIVVTTSKLSPCEANKVTDLAIQLIQRENVGHDFYSYKIGIDAIEDWSDINQLVLCNDSCFGPLFPLSEIFDAFKHQNADFWGMSANHRPCFHIQSFFLVFNTNVVRSRIFQSFWSNLSILKDKDQIVLNYEVGLSQQLINAGFIANAWLADKDYQINTLKLIWRKLLIFINEFDKKNSRYSWKNLFEPLTRIDKTISLYDYSIRYYRFPFLKKSLLKDNWLKLADIVKIITKYTKYNSKLIRDAFHD